MAYKLLDLRVINCPDFSFVEKITDRRSVSHKQKSRLVQREIADAMPAVSDMDRKVGETAGAHRHTVLCRQVVTDRALIRVLQVRDLTDNEIVRLRNRVHSGSERKGI